MGELHLDIYVERMKREYNVSCVTGKPRVAFRETITESAPFEYVHKKQSGGSGQYGKVKGIIEPMEMDEDTGKDTAFENRIVGGSIPQTFIPAIEKVCRPDRPPCPVLADTHKGFQEALDRGQLTGHPINGTRFVLTDGQHHIVDSNELSFRLAALGAFRDAFPRAKPVVLEPVMTVEVVAPIEFQGSVIGAMNQRKGTIVDTEVRDDEFTLLAEVALNDMFGYAGQLRGMTQGKGESFFQGGDRRKRSEEGVADDCIGEFTMEYKKHAPVLPNVQREMMEAFRKKTITK